MQQIGIDLIKRGPWTSRFERSDINDLSVSRVRKAGLIESLLLTGNPVDGYEIVGSSTPWMLAQAAQIHEVPSIVNNSLSVQEKKELSNKTSLSDHFLDTAEKIMETLNNSDRGVSKARIGIRLGMTRGTVCNYHRVALMPGNVKIFIRDHSFINMGHAKIVASLRAGEQLSVLRKVELKKLTVQKTESLVRDLKAPLENRVEKEDDASIEKPVEVTYLEEALTGYLGCVVEINMGSGKLEINYHGDNDLLEGVIAKMGYSFD